LPDIFSEISKPETENPKPQENAVMIKKNKKCRRGNFRGLEFPVFGFEVKPQGF
jgi:hypothetical protein